MARIERTELSALYVRHDRQTEGCATRCRRTRGGDGDVDAHGVRRRSRAGHVFDVRRRLGGRSQLQHLRAADRRRRGALVRRVANQSRRGHLVAVVRKISRALDVLVADRNPRAEEAGSGVAEEIRPVEAPMAVSCRRAARRADGALDQRRSRQTGHRQLLADRDWLADPVPAARTRSGSRSASAHRVSRTSATNCA